MTFSDKLTLIGIIISVIGIGFAIYIPEKIKWEQTYSSLISDYRGYDFATALQGVIQFFANDCNHKVENIKKNMKNDL